ncbi:NAD(P)H-binding protein [Hamadaea tsunoensis]|uniref:NAD(P)H-binding protein n=1 Tax=Hamadaea tsunoensis TaxID=53368 RepID=UPI0003F5CDE3|nr:NAD(P)H-binding protein [Hamadaea tsunoensis]
MIVVTGATGNVGRPLVRALAEAGSKVTAVSRSITPEGVPEGVRAVVADLTTPDSLDGAFDGAEALFLHDGAASAANLRPAEILDRARAAGIRKVVQLSSQGVVTRPESRSHGVMMKSVEDAVRASGLDWTILRPGAFASNAYAWVPSIRAGRSMAAPFGDVGLPVVDPADIAAVAAAALTGEGHAGQIYELNGPALITPRQMAETLAGALGEPVRFTELTRDEAYAVMTSFMPAWAVETTLAVLGTPTAREQAVSPDIQRVLGRPARSFADWVRENVEAYR